MVEPKNNKAMLKDIDLDMQNFFNKKMDDDELVVYAHVSDDTLVKIFHGEESDVADMLLQCEELHDILITVAAHIVIENDINFDDILKFVKDETKKH